MNRPRCECAGWRIEYLAEFERQIAARGIRHGIVLAQTAMAAPLAEMMKICRHWCPRMRASFDSAAWTYFIRVGNAGPIKIGKADDLSRRVASLQTAHANELTVFSATLGGRPLERFLHQAFATDCIRGEWYRPTRRVLGFAYEMDDRVPRRYPEQVLEFWMNQPRERRVA